MLFRSVRFSVRLASGRLISRVAYVVDMCICAGRHNNPNDDRVVDMSPALWALFYPARAEGNRRILAEVIAP